MGLLQLAQIFLCIGIATGSGTTEALQGFLLLTAEPVGYPQGILRALIVAHGEQLLQSLVVTVYAVGRQQFAGFIDNLGSLVGNIVIVNADIAGVTLVFEYILTEILPRLSAIHAAQLLFAHVEVALAVDDVEGLLQLLLLWR